MGGEAIEKIITVQLLTDSKSLFRVISKDSRTSEERLMLEIAEAGDRVREKAIFDIGFVRSSSIPPTASRNNFAGRSSVCCLQWISVRQTGAVNHPHLGGKTNYFTSVLTSYITSISSSPFNSFLFHCSTSLCFQIGAPPAPLKASLSNRRSAYGRRRVAEAQKSLRSPL